MPVFMRFLPPGAGFSYGIAVSAPFKQLSAQLLSRSIAFPANFRYNRTKQSGQAEGSRLTLDRPAHYCETRYRQREAITCDGNNNKELLFILHADQGGVSLNQTDDVEQKSPDTPDHIPACGRYGAAVLSGQ